MATLEDLFQVKRACITAQRAFLLQQRELNALQMEKLDRMEADIATEEKREKETADRIELGHGK